MIRIGDVFGKWTVIQYRHKVSVQNKAYKGYLCRCSCGLTERYISESDLNIKNESSGCIKCRVKYDNSSVELSRSYFTKVRIRAKNSNIPFNISIDYINNLYLTQNRQCALSGIELLLQKENYSRSKGSGRTQTASLDRIDSTKGYVEGNIQWIHKDINMIKKAYSQDYFIELCKKIAAHNDNTQNESNK